MDVDHWIGALRSYPTPIAGSKLHAHTPTSADVHLYADPELHHSRTPHLYQIACEGLKRAVSDPEVHHATSTKEIAISEENLYCKLPSRPALPLRECITGDVRLPGSIVAGPEASGLHQDLLTTVEVGTVQVNEPVELPVPALASNMVSFAELPTRHGGISYQQNQTKAYAVASSRRQYAPPSELIRATKDLLDESRDQYKSESNEATTSADRKASARRKVQRSSPPITQSTSSQDKRSHHVLRNNPIRANTAPTISPQFDLSMQELSHVKRPERERRPLPLSYAAKQRLPQSVTTQRRPHHHSLNQRLQYMSSVSTIISLVSDGSEVSVADSIDVEAFDRRAAERAERERLKLMPSNSSLSYGDIG